MCKEGTAFMVGLVLALFFVVVFGVLYKPYDRAYKDGQVDALNGTNKYELIEHKDQSKSWEKILPRADHANSER